MKKSVVVALSAMFILGGTVLMAQPPQGGQQREQVSIEKRVEQMQETLKLTDKQCEQIVALEESRESQRPQQGQKMDREAMQKQMEAYQTEMKEILTDEQYTSWQEMMQRRQQGQREKKN